MTKRKRTDKERLDWLQNNEADVVAPWVVSAYRWHIRDQNNMNKEYYGQTLRQVIDSVMNGNINKIKIG